MPGPSLPGHVAIVIHLSCWRFGSWPLHFCALCHYSLRAAHHTFLLSTHFPFQYLLWVPGSFTVTCPIDLLLCEALALFPMTSHCPLVFKSVLPSHWVIWSFPSLLPVVWPERTFPLIPIWPKIAHCSPPPIQWGHGQVFLPPSCLDHANNETFFITVYCSWSVFYSHAILLPACLLFNRMPHAKGLISANFSPSL